MDQKSPSSLKNFCMFAEGKLNGTKRMIRNVVDERLRVFNLKALKNMLTILWHCRRNSGYIAGIVKKQHYRAVTIQQETIAIYC